MVCACCVRTSECVYLSRSHEVLASKEACVLTNEHDPRDVVPVVDGSLQIRLKPRVLRRSRAVVVLRAHHREVN